MTRIHCLHENRTVYWFAINTESYRGLGTIRSWLKNGTKNPPGKGSTLCKNMLLLAIDISNSQCFTATVVMNKN